MSKLQSLRVSLGMTQQELATRCNIPHRQYICQWERGKFTHPYPTLKQVERLTKVLGENPFSSELITVIKWREGGK